MFCPNCGFPYGPDDRFCGRCGAALPAREDASPASPSPEPSPPPPRPKRRLPRFVIPAVLVLAAAAGALTFFLTRPPQLDPSFGLYTDWFFSLLLNEDATQLELWSGTERLLTLPAESAGLRSVSASFLDEDEPVLLLVDAEGDLYRADSKSCSMLAQQAQSCSLSCDGSTAVWVDGEHQLHFQRGDAPPVTAAEDAAYSTLLSYGGKSLVWETALIPDSGPRYYCLSLDGGQSQGLPADDISPLLVTDSGTVYYVSMRSGSCHLYAWKGGESTQITDCLSLSASLRFNQDGTQLLYVTEDDSGASTWFYREGEEPRRIGSFALNALCVPSYAEVHTTYVTDSPLAISQYNVSTLLEKVLDTDQGLWLLDREAAASPVFPESTTPSVAYVSQDGNSLVVQTTGRSEANVLYRFDDLWGDPVSQMLAQGHILSLLGASPDLSLLLYTLPAIPENARDYYALRAGGEPVFLTQGNEFAVVTSANIICFASSSDDRAQLFLSDGVGAPIPLDLSIPEDSYFFVHVAQAGDQSLLRLGSGAVTYLFTVSPDGALTLLTTGINPAY